MVVTTINYTFGKLSRVTSKAVASPYAFATALGFVLGWAFCGPHYHYSDTWQLVVNTITTLVTFLMVFLLQNSQERATAALSLKLDEVIRAIKPADNRVMFLEDLSDEEVDKLRDRLKSLAKKG